MTADTAMEDRKLEALVAAAVGAVRLELKAEVEAMVEARVEAEVEARLAEAVKQLNGTTPTNATDGAPPTPHMASRIPWPEERNTARDYGTKHEEEGR